MKRVKTTQGKAYVVTAVTVPCRILSNGIELACAESVGQVSFVAIAEEVDVDQDDAIITPVFKGASIGNSGGGSIATDLSAHKQDTVLHVALNERTTWNNKADASALSSKVDTSTFNAHTENKLFHTTVEEKCSLMYLDFEKFNSVTVGRTKCEGSYNVVIGNNACCQTGSSGVGFNTIVGYNARTATNVSSTVIGALAYCNGHFSVALGYKATSYAERSVVIGAEWTSERDNTSVFSATDGLNEFGVISVEKTPGSAPRFIFGYFDKLADKTNKAVAISMDNLYALLKANGGVDYKFGEYES